MAAIIDSERFGMRQEFIDVAEAQQSIRECGPEFASVELAVYGDEIAVEPAGERVGYVRDREPIND